MNYMYYVTYVICTVFTITRLLCQLALPIIDAPNA
jgi:hypothetical protein